jgi:hypothetical protein
MHRKSNFAARFLPFLVAGYKSRPDDAHLFGKIMAQVTASPYVGRFMRNPLGSDLYLFHAEKTILVDVHSRNVCLP